MNISVALYTVTTITSLTEVHIAVVECLSSHKSQSWPPPETREGPANVG